MTTAGYASVVRQLLSAAGKTPIALVTEGGYDLRALADCLDASFAVLSRSGSDAVVDSESDPGRGTAVRAERALQAVRAAQAPFWREI
jgi:acetoin utilization deacetylase AcuC-like enzyme